MLNFIKKLFSNNENSSSNSNAKIITAKVTKIEKHPNADRLRIITLSDGVKTYSPIVCGAFNFSEGDIVALALPEATIAHNIHSDNHESFTLGTAKIC
jgi:tRNA-binding EMAP/Myf-like protein